jgi:GT2 family glycosyltransferase
MENQIDVSIVIVNFNTLEYTIQCIESIDENPPDCNYEIVVVDNASWDNSADHLEQRFDYVNLIRSNENRGIAGGNNLGIVSGTGRYVLLLNNDTIVIRGSIDRTVEFLDEHPEAAGVGGQLLNEDGSFQSGAYHFPSLWQDLLIATKIGQLIHSYYPSLPPSRGIHEADWLSTAFMLFRRDALESVNHVDEEFFIYSDESDLQYRLKKVGWKIYFLSDVQTIHFGGKSLNPWRRRKMVYRGYLLFYRKHYEVWKEIILRLIFVSVSFVKLPIWSLALIFESKRSRAKEELRSNIDILKMCVQWSIIPARA